jgi:hypothetical protein
MDDVDDEFDGVIDHEDNRVAIAVYFIKNLGAPPQSVGGDRRCHLSDRT